MTTRKTPPRPCQPVRVDGLHVGDEISFNAKQGPTPITHLSRVYGMIQVETKGLGSRRLHANDLVLRYTPKPPTAADQKRIR